MARSRTGLLNHNNTLHAMKIKVVAPSLLWVLFLSILACESHVLRYCVGRMIPHTIAPQQPPVVVRRTTRRRRTESVLCGHNDDHSFTSTTTTTTIELPTQPSPFEEEQPDDDYDADMLISSSSALFSTTSENHLPIAAVVLSDALVLVAATYGVVCLLENALLHYEWMQTWRYLWPFGIGGFYLFQSVSSSCDDSRLFAGLDRLSMSLLGMGVIIGGAYDAFMPVYMTGPNVFTAAGIGQDAAFGLLCVQMLQSMLRGSDNNNQSTTDRCMQILLLAELYILGEGTVNEIQMMMGSVLQQ